MHGFVDQTLDRVAAIVGGITLATQTFSWAGQTFSLLVIRVTFPGPALVVFLRVGYSAGLGRELLRAAGQFNAPLYK